MSDITITKTIKLNIPLSEHTIKNTLENKLKKRFFFEFNNENRDKFSCHFNLKSTLSSSERLFGGWMASITRYMVTIYGGIQLQVQSNSMLIVIDAVTKRNGHFWFVMLLSMIFFPFNLINLWSYSRQKKQSAQEFNFALNKTEIALQHQMALEQTNLSKTKS